MVTSMGGLPSSHQTHRAPRPHKRLVLLLGGIGRDVCKCWGAHRKFRSLGRLPGRGHILVSLYKTSELPLDKEGGRRIVLGRGISSR